MKPCVNFFFHVIYIMDDIFCNMKYLFYKFMYCLSNVVIVLCDGQFSNQNNYLKCHYHWRPYRRTNVRRHFTELKNNYLKCHYHRRPYRRTHFRRYVVGGSLLPTTSLTDCVNSKERCINWPHHFAAELPTECEKYGG
jgi:hypothetical protein